MTEINGKEPTLNQVMYALKCKGYHSSSRCVCEDCFYRECEHMKECQDLARDDALEVLEKYSWVVEKYEQAKSKA